jgi:hypothetical protein
MKLTKVSKDKLYNQFNGNGIIFIKTGCREMMKFEFYLGQNKKFYVINNAVPAIELTQVLYGIIPEIESEEIEGGK